MKSAELLKTLIRNQCVNDGTADSGHESRNADVLETLFSSSVDVERHGEIEGRDSLVVRLEGSDPSAPSLLFLGHTDVVPANASQWERDPFGGDIENGIIYGRGAVDMLNLTSAMALSLNDFAETGVSPRGTIIFAAVADEEAGGGHGAEYLLREYPEVVSADFVLSETGGMQMPVNDKTYLPVVVREKGVHWITISIKGASGHGSIPFGSDNAVVTAGQIINRIHSYRPPMKLVDGWQEFITALDLAPDIEEHISDDQQEEALGKLNTKLAAVIHAGCHHTFTPTVVQGGSKVNTIADSAQISVDIRSLPGTSLDDVARMTSEALGDLSDKVEITYLQNAPSSISKTDNPLWKLLQNASENLVPHSELLPITATYGTDARFFREAGSIAYGTGLFSPAISFEEHLGMFHGANERIDIASLELTRQYYGDILTKFAEM